MDIDKNNLIKQNNLFFVFCFVVIGWIVYSPMTSWLISNPDGIYLGVIYREGDGSAAFGRIGVGAVIRLMYSVVSPNLMMILCLIMLGIIVCMMATIFKADSLWMRILMGVILLLSPTMSSQLTYYYCMVQYILAFVFSVLACLLIIRVKQSWMFVVSSIFVMAQLTLYQAFLSVSVVISLYYLIYLLLNNEEYKSIVLTAIRLFGSMISGIVLYVLLLRVLRVELDSVRGFDSMGRVNVEQRIGLIKTAYWYFLDYLFGDAYINNSWMHRKYMNLIVVVSLTLIVIYIIAVKRIYKQKLRMIMLLVCALAFPVGFELMVVAAPKVNMHGVTGIIMIPAMSMLYMSVIWLWNLIPTQDEGDEQMHGIMKCLRRYGCVLVLVPILYNYILFTSVFENVMWLNYQSMYSLCHKISMEIDDVGGYESDARIAFIGYPQDGNYPYNRDELRDIVRGTIAERGQIWENSGYLSSCIFQAFYRTYFGIDYELVLRDEYNRIVESGLISGMGNFPEEGSVVRKGDLIIVKVSDIQ